MMMIRYFFFFWCSSYWFRQRFRPCSGHRNLAGLARGDSCIGNANSRLSQHEVNYTLKWQFFRPKQNPIAGKDPLEVFTPLEASRPRAPEKTVDLRE